MADRYHADDVTIFDAGAVPDHTVTVKFYSGQFYNFEDDVTEHLLSIEGLSFRLHNFDPQTDDELHFPRCRFTFDFGVASGARAALDPSYWLPGAQATKRTKFRLQISTENTGDLIDHYFATIDFEVNDDETITFEVEHPLREWRRNAVSVDNAVTAESNLIPNT
jgi:hypothetical protein